MKFVFIEIKLPPIEAPKECKYTKDLYSFVDPTRYMKSLCVIKSKENYFKSSIFCQKNRMRLFTINDEYVEAALHDALMNCCHDGYDSSYWILEYGNKNWRKDYFKYVEYCTYVQLNKYDGYEMFQKYCYDDELMSFCEFNNSAVYQENVHMIQKLFFTSSK